MKSFVKPILYGEKMGTKRYKKLPKMGSFLYLFMRTPSYCLKFDALHYV